MKLESLAEPNGTKARPQNSWRGHAKAENQPSKRKLLQKARLKSSKLSSVADLSKWLELIWLYHSKISERDIQIIIYYPIKSLRVFCIEKFKSAAIIATTIFQGDRFLHPFLVLIQNADLSLRSIAFAFHEFRANDLQFLLLSIRDVSTWPASRQREESGQGPGRIALVFGMEVTAVVSSTPSISTTQFEPFRSSREEDAHGILQNCERLRELSSNSSHSFFVISVCRYLGNNLIRVLVGRK